jgi:hypothetical protein
VRQVPDVIEELYSWLLGLPWVVERDGVPEAPGVRWFGVDCEPLDRRCLWLVVAALDGKDAAEYAIHLVLPAQAALRIALAGDIVELTSVGEDHFLLTLRAESFGPVNRARLDELLLLAYEGCFA